jgi:hypothetical protein
VIISGFSSKNRAKTNLVEIKATMFLVVPQAIEKEAELWINQQSREIAETFLPFKQSF